MRVVIAEDSGLLRQMLAEMLTIRGLSVIGQAGTPSEVLCLVAADPPDVVLLDIRMPPSYSDEGLQVAERILAGYPSVGVLILSHYAETAYALRLLEVSSRAVGYLVKDRVQDADRLVEAIQRVSRGETVIDPEVVQRLLRKPRVANPLDRLTEAERQVLALVAEGFSNVAIAHALSYSVKTIEKRVAAIMWKLGLLRANQERADINLRVLAVLAYLHGTDEV